MKTGPFVARWAVPNKRNEQARHGCAWAALAGVLLWAVAGGSAFAQNSGLKPFSEMLKDAKPAGTMCAKNEPAVAASGGQVRSETPDLNCAIEANQVLPLLGRPDAVLVDTRLPRDFALSHVDGALNMRVEELRVKSFLAGKQLVLMGNGKNERELYVACAGLKKAGFKQIKVVRGGMPAWVAQAQPVNGQAGALESALRLDAAGLWSESRFDANLVLLTPGMAGLRKELPGAVVLRDDGLETIKAAVEKRRRDPKLGPLAAVVVAAGAWPDERVQQLVKTLNSVPVLMYAEGTDAFGRFVASQEAMWKAHARGPKQPKCGA